MLIGTVCIQCECFHVLGEELDPFNPEVELADLNAGDQHEVTLTYGCTNCV